MQLVVKALKDPLAFLLIFLNFCGESGARLFGLEVS